MPTCEVVFHEAIASTSLLTVLHNAWKGNNFAAISCREVISYFLSTDIPFLQEINIYKFRHLVERKRKINRFYFFIWIKLNENPQLCKAVK